MENIRHLYGEVRNVPEPESESRTVQFVISTNAKDRHGTVLNQENWKLDNFNKNPIVGYQHNVYGDPCREPNPDDVLGPARAWIENGQLLGEVTFETKDINPLAEKIFRKIQNGTLRATSVGFVPVGKGNYGIGEESEGGSRETYYFEGQELLEFSVVNIPSNPEAIKKSLRESTSNAIMHIKNSLGDKVSFSDIESMTVGDVIRSLEKGEVIRSATKTLQEITKEDIENAVSRGLNSINKTETSPEEVNRIKRESVIFNKKQEFIKRSKK